MERAKTMVMGKRESKTQGNWNWKIFSEFSDHNDFDARFELKPELTILIQMEENQMKKWASKVSLWFRRMMSLKNEEEQQQQNFYFFRTS